MNVRPGTMKLLRSTGGAFFGIGLRNIFVDYVSLGKENKSKNKHMGLHQTKKLLHSKGNH